MRNYKAARTGVNLPVSRSRSVLFPTPFGPTIQTAERKKKVMVMRHQQSVIRISIEHLLLVYSVISFNNYTQVLTYFETPYQYQSQRF